MGTFSLGTSEFAPMGMLPVIAHAIHVSIPKAGLLISAYAIGVTLSAPLMILLLSGQAYRKSLISLMLIFTLGNLLSTLAPNFTVLLLARIFTSLSHGAFFGLGAVVAAASVPKKKQSSAIATTVMGLTIANITGVPAATWVANTVSWRMSFLGTAGLGIITLLVIYFALPPTGIHSDKRDRHIKQEFSILVRPKTLLALFATVLCSTSMFTLYTYIVPVLNTVTHATPVLITKILIVIGVGFSIGNYLGGKCADYSVDLTLKGFLLLIIATMVAMPFVARNELGAGLCMALWGAAAFATSPPLQMQVMRAASEAPELASSVNIGAFNFGNALGAALGSATISSGLIGYASIPVLGASVAAVALLFIIITHLNRV